MFKRIRWWLFCALLFLQALIPASTPMSDSAFYVVVLGDPESPRQVEDIFEIVQKLRDKTGENYVVAYGGSSNPGDNLDEVWSGFSLRKFDFKKVSSK